MKIIKIDNFRDWLEWRMGGIGGSDAPAIMNSCKFQTKEELWAKKTERMLPEKENFRMKRGKRLEPIAREEYEHLTGVKMPKTLVEHDKYPYLKLSADGLNASVGGALEIKCPSAEDHVCAIKGEVPKHYIWQIRHILMVTGVDWVDYFSYNPDYAEPFAIVTVKRDLKKEELLKKMCKDFWHWVLKDQYPKPIELKPAVFRTRRNKFEVEHEARRKRLAKVIELRGNK